MKIAIAVHGRFHAFDLAAGLARCGATVQVTTTYPAFVARRWLPAGIAVRSAPHLEAWRRAHARLPGLVPDPEPALHRRFGAFAARTLPDDADVFVGWSGACREAIEAARARGIATVLERGSTHILHQQATLAREYARLGMGIPPIHPEIVERELSEYAAADAIAVPTRHAAASFIAHDVPESKLIVNPLGVAARRFDGPRSAPAIRPRILFVGAVGPRKGVPRLLDVFERLGGAVELRLAGRVENGMGEILRHTDARVTVLGAISADELVREYLAADIFCLPSLEEGFGLVVAEAMAAGLPVVASDATAAIELVRPGVDGIVFPAGDDSALAAALDGLINDKDRREAMGASARERIAAFDWDATASRAMEAYGRIRG